jgi:uncharacterized membrane protein
MIMEALRSFSLVVAIVLLGALLGGGLYESVVMAPNYRSNIPQSLDHVKQFFSVANPGNYFRVVAPATQITLLATLLLNWTVKSRRWWLIAAFVMSIGMDIITFTYHYPRNAILFSDPLNTPVEVLTAAAAEWMYANLVRCFLIVSAMFCTISAAMRPGFGVYQEN